MIDDSIKVIAFDCFDTLFYRKCHPEVSLFSWAKNMAATIDFAVEPDVLYDIRKLVEKKIKQQKKVEEIKYERLIEEIYKVLFSKVENICLTRTEFIEVSYSIEIMVEKQMLYINEKNLHKLEKYKEKNLQTIIISDFYMGYRFFEEILLTFGIKKFIDRIYISSEFGVRKSSGNLYNVALQDLNINANEMLMIGDNPLSDQQIPQKLGIKTNPMIYNCMLSYKNKKQIENFQRNYFISNKETFFSGFLPLTLLFVERIFRFAKINRCKKLLFCSREGQVLKTLFDLYQQMLFPYESIQTEYLYVSRRSTLLPSLKKLNEENFERIFRQYKNISMFDFLYSIGFEEKEINDFCKRYLLDTEQTINMNSKLLQDLKKNNDFMMTYEKKRVEQKELLKKYIYSINGSDEETIYLVDVGWKGTIQDNIFCALDRKKKLIGLYLGLVKETKQSANNLKYGLVFDENDNKNEFCLFNYIEMEKLFVANHGPVLKYEKYNNIIKPKCSEDKKDIEIYIYVKEWLIKFEALFFEGLTYYKESKFLIENFEKQLKGLYLKHLCIVEPKYFEIYTNFRNIAKENFGNISKIKNKDKKYTNTARKLRKKFLYVDCAYKILDKMGLRGFEFLATFYCRIVYIIMKIKLQI